MYMKHSYHLKGLPSFLPGQYGFLVMLICGLSSLDKDINNAGRQILTLDVLMYFVCILLETISKFSATLGRNTPRKL